MMAIEARRRFALMMLGETSDRQAFLMACDDQRIAEMETLQDSKLDCP